MLSFLYDRAHWYLVLICFPGLEEPQCEEGSSPASLRGTGGEKPDEAQAEEEASGSKKLNGISEVTPESISTDNQDKLTVTGMCVCSPLILSLRMLHVFMSN